VLMDAGTEHIHGCRVIDPYGWEGFTSDPFGQTDSRGAPPNPLAAPQAGPAWDLAALGTTLPVVAAVHIRATSTQYQLTIDGTGFRPGGTVTLWRKSDGGYLARISPSQMTPTHILSVLPAPFGHEIGELLLKVQNPAGPRSRAVFLSPTHRP
jgi:hypothetical protein